MKKTLFSILIISLLIGLACQGRKLASLSPTKVYVEATIPQIKDMAAYVVISGTIKPQQETILSSKIAGRVKRVPLKEGMEVKKGQLIIHLEEQELELQLAAAQSTLKAAIAAIDEKNFERKKRLFQERVVTKAEFDRVESQYHQAVNQKKNAEKIYKLREQQYRDTYLNSPLDGVVASLKIEPGEVVAPGIPLAKVINTKAVLVEVEISSKDITQVKKDQKVLVRVDSYPQQNFAGIITTISPIAEEFSRTFKTKILVDNAQNLLRAGMFAEVKIITAEHKNAIVIPKEALVRQEGLSGDHLYIIQDQKAHLKKITPGLQDTSNIEILDPWFTPDLQVVTAGQNNLKDNSPIIIIGGEKH